jgi:Glycine rich protein
MRMRIRRCGFLGAIVVLCGILSSSAQTGSYMFTGSETTVTLNPGLYDITAYGAQGGTTATNFGSIGIGGLGAEMSAKFSFTGLTTLTLLVGGAGQSGDGGGRQFYCQWQ